MKKPLPTVNGIGPSCLRIFGARDRTILEYLKERFPKMAPEIWIVRMQEGRVVDESGNHLMPHLRCREGAYIYYYRELEKEIKIPFEERVIYRDKHILVADKPHFLPVTPSGIFLQETLLVRLKKRLGLDHLVPLHRIDRETAGLVVFSHNPETRGSYASLFQKYKVQKSYEALARAPSDIKFPLIRKSRIVSGDPFFRMKEIEGIANADTWIDVIEMIGDLARYELRPRTGRKHQLRVHMAALGMPIINDRIYPVAWPQNGEDFSSPLQLLAKSVSFEDPLTKETMFFESKLRL
ncbi:MAG: pseudouridine synthase [Syntrophorhabdaceae bacterium]